MNSTRSRAILCPNCRKLINADEPKCPYCRTRRPGSFLKNNPWTRAIGNSDALVWMIIYVNIGLFVLAILMNPLATQMTLNPLSAFAPSDRSLILLGATGTWPIERTQRWWTLLSANYLHGSLLHILFNMMAFRQIGIFIGREFGASRMLTIYTVSGVAGFWVSYLAGVSLTIGASASLFGLIGAALYFGKSRGGVYGETVFKQLLGWAAVLFIFGIVVPGINNWGHGGGLVAGAVCALLLGYNDQRPERIHHKMVGAACAVVTVLVLVWAVGTGLYFHIWY